MTDGIVNVLKPPGMTSHDVVSRIRRIYGIQKAGHSGTLDPDAAGVLPVFIGNATRLLEYAATASKRKRFTTVPWEDFTGSSHVFRIEGQREKTV